MNSLTKRYFVVVEIDAYAGNVERQLVTYSFGAYGEHGWDGRDEDWRFSHDMGPTLEEMEADPVLNDMIGMWSESVVGNYGEYGYSPIYEMERAGDNWVVVLELGARYYEDLLSPAHWDFLYRRLTEAGEIMGFSIVDVRVRMQTVDTQEQSMVSILSLGRDRTT